MDEIQDLLLQNLEFFRSMRREYYGKACELFRILEAEVLGGTASSDRKGLGLLGQYIEVLELTSEYARSTIRGYRRNKVKSFRHDPKWGIMEEEIVFVYFLEELQSSSIYLRNRLETNGYIHHYIEVIQNRDDFNSKKKGFLAKILTYLKADLKADKEEIAQLVQLIRKRFKIASEIFEVIEKRRAKALVR